MTQKTASRFLFDDVSVDTLRLNVNGAGVQQASDNPFSLDNLVVQKSGLHINVSQEKRGVSVIVQCPLDVLMQQFEQLAREDVETLEAFAMALLGFVGKQRVLDGKP